MADRKKDPERAPDQDPDEQPDSDSPSGPVGAQPVTDERGRIVVPFVKNPQPGK